MQGLRKDNLIASDIVIRNAKPREKPYRVKDAKGFYLLINPDVSKWWRLDYSINQKRKTLSLGVYPDVSLATARQKFQEARGRINEGIDPSEIRKQAKAEQAKIQDQVQRLANGIPLQDSFEEVARDWMENKYRHEVAALTHKKTKSRLEQYVFPVIGQMPIADLKPAHDVSTLFRTHCYTAFCCIS